MKVAVHGYHAGKSWLCICVGVEPPFSKSWIRHCIFSSSPFSCYLAIYYMQQCALLRVFCVTT